MINMTPDKLKAKAQKLFVPTTMFSVSYSDFDSFIQDAYGVENYSIVKDQELRRDSAAKVFNVDDQGLNEWDALDVERFPDGTNFNYVTGRLLRDLCSRGIIEAGRYTIRFEES